MLKTTLFMVVGLALGLAAASWWQGRSGPSPSPASALPAELAARIVELEAGLNRETLRRAELETELRALRVSLDQLETRAAADVGADAGAARELVSAAPASEASPPAVADDRVQRLRGGRDLEDNLTERLLAAGFSADRAAWIGQRTAELRMEALQAQYEAAREGEFLGPRAVLGVEDTLRAELGDAEYERYLEATGRATTVNVGRVLASSPAEQSGLLPGDRVVAYAGQRVFDMRDLNRLVLEGTEGEPVTVDILRDELPLQLVLPRGPIGITGRGGFGRR